MLRLVVSLVCFPFLLWAEGEQKLVHLGTNPNASLEGSSPSLSIYYFGFTKESHYYQIKLEEDPNRYFHFENGMLSELDCELIQDGKITKQFQTGLLRKKNPDVSYTGGFLFPAKEKGIYRFRIQSDDTHRINFRIRKESELFQYTKSLSLWQGLYLGLCILLCLFTAAQYILLREKISLLLTFATFTVLFTNVLRSGLFYEYGFSDFDWFYRYVPGLLSLSPIGFVLFLREFLHTKTKHPNFDRYVMVYIYMMFLSMGVSIFDLQLYFRFIYTNSLMLSTATFAYSIYCLIQKKEHANVLFFAFLVRQISTTLLIFTNTGYLPSFPFLSSANEIGAAIQMTIFTIVISKFQIQERIIKEQTVTKVNEELEFMVSERTKELQLQKEKLENAILQLSQTENQLALSEKMTELGKLVAGVAHEINNPLSAIKASIETLMESKQNETIHLGTKENIYSTLDIAQIQTLTRMFQYQSDFGLVASYTERKEKKAELKKILKDNGLDYEEATLEKFLDVGITKLEENQIHLLQQGKDKLTDLILEEKNFRLHLSIIQIAVDRSSKIILALKNFSRVTHSEQRKIFTLLDNIETVITIYQYRMRSKVSLKKTFLTDATILGWPEDLMRVWTNLILNALEAMKTKGNLTISTEKNGRHVEVKVIDNGPGIPIEIQNRIFEPFFTTKQQGEGTGMGLGITKSIIEKHFGKITVESEPGRTCFCILLPAIELIDPHATE
ncbi:Sensor histidine kinase and response regulator of a two component response regulator [Leptospira biflexa serovar Patoc strain 'Patoc 1 (Ames)']|uniref:histidine kinase n=1 Tax=Leptospira biflexa serovar Patoc (strain Patoc 1 / ATCC 23582 / Paris) TaxID=456481 RepID=B0SKM3_LEPBP|nr:ATP-binding protein [Leptospira biflexa]ABZ93157.1 Sensor histidine kinase and response regulator of a two component response regulator [Leptospira biflexa serovar Patoc strain 'Patoc 1 (Ames)']ABZ96780.1 Putative two-component sensor protein; putative membrane protein; putative signal peptide [Leptospira biflexa serovar Patoc strain 'Patoc 1 (Paris)']